MATSTTIFQILKAIDLSYENQNFNFETTLDLEKMKISQHRLDLLLENLINDGYIQGIKVVRCSGGSPLVSIGLPRLTNAGLFYLEDNTEMKKAYNILKEIKGWIPGM